MKETRVLIVDDDEDFREVMKLTIAYPNIIVETAESGEDAIRMFRQREYDIAFLDIMLPGMNGVESFMEIRKFKPEARVVMMTGYSVDQLLEQAADNGAWAVMTKPLDMAKVLNLINDVGKGGILIVDDDPDFVESIKRMLENASLKVYVSHNGQEAIERVLKNGIDVLILDLRMPILDGLGTYTELKKRGVVLPTIIVTAYATEDSEKLRALQEMNVSGILRKPFNPQELLETLNHLLETDRPDA